MRKLLFFVLVGFCFPIVSVLSEEIPTTSSNQKIWPDKDIPGAASAPSDTRSITQAECDRLHPKMRMGKDNSWRTVKPGTECRFDANGFPFEVVSCGNGVVTNRPVAVQIVYKDRPVYITRWKTIYRDREKEIIRYRVVKEIEEQWFFVTLASQGGASVQQAIVGSNHISSQIGCLSYSFGGNRGGNTYIDVTATGGNGYGAAAAAAAAAASTSSTSATPTSAAGANNGATSGTSGAAP